MAATYIFGEIPGNPVGTTYADRNAAKDAGVHQVNMQGISGNGTVGANSIVVNGGYEDDDDQGDEIVYTGAGGNDPRTKKQIADQEITQVGNAALVVSEENALPVRVIRGHRGDPAHAPLSGYRYDGLYRVSEHWAEEGKSGFRVWRFRLERLSSTEAHGFAPASSPLPAGAATPGRRSGVVQRVVRNTRVAAAVKNIHGHACQICGVHLDLPVGDYAEGAHIRALGSPHNGPDEPDNVLCLCPTHHVLFDKGAIYIDQSLQVHDHRGNAIGLLSVHRNHPIRTDHLAYHRQAHGL